MVSNRLGILNFNQTKTKYNTNMHKDKKQTKQIQNKYKTNTKQIQNKYNGWCPTKRLISNKI